MSTYDHIPGMSPTHVWHRSADEAENNEPTEYFQPHKSSLVCCHPPVLHSYDIKVFQKQTGKRKLSPMNEFDTHASCASQTGPLEQRPSTVAPECSAGPAEYHGEPEFLRQKTDCMARASKGCKRVCQPSTSLTSPKWSSKVDSTTGFSHQHSPQQNGVLRHGQDDFRPSRPDGKRSRREKRGLSAVMPKDHRNESVNHDAEFLHPLSELKWPFDEIFAPIEEGPKGVHNVVTTQPTTTGSQGIPHFITAGPSLSLFGTGMFGYEREDTILWA